MEPKLEKILFKTGRYKYFQMQISLGIKGPRINFLLIEVENLLKILKAAKFIDQVVLEKTLFNLEIQDRGRFIRLKRFAGQLERDSINGAPYWNIFLQTVSLTTPRRIADGVSKELFQTNNTIDSTIKVLPSISFGSLQKEDRLTLPNSDWYPGYFSHKTVELISLLQQQEVREWIQENPERCGGLI
jgi:hypothetical protein